MKTELYGKLCLQDPEQWFFFCPRQEREANGGRPNRITPSGYWKATGCSNRVYSTSKRRLGVKRTMVFYMGRAIAGKKTMWKMNEYRLFEDATIANGETPKVEIGQGRVFFHERSSLFQ
ncbi:hypothetical protein HPP92_013385 [Vanilla planifolia]|uniref:NAC domain-containing protein n=1 Tax=Vanilla planifolia TaxID=51239 RepID=A0A835QQR4_VANPL|nr:hypothetical protein HPP92_013815 [Vanilla planifolia]KAG0478666.1 hypothetical protein HPP92_013385 [Vanilla planifolia]